MNGTARSGATVSREQVVAAFFAFCEGSSQAVAEVEGKLVADAIEELVELRTAAFDDWYVRNHYRYRTMRETERRRASYLGRTFLGQLQLGKVELG